ncbi:MAG: electron transport complex subunit RsxC [Pseudomonadota bacterium]
MSLALEGLPGSGTFAHGIHPPDRKNFSSDVAIEVIPSAKSVLLPLMQNAGAPCAPVVKARQVVVYGEMVADAQAFVSAPLHSPINGKVLKTGMTTLPNGRHVPAIPIEAEGDQISARELWDDTYGGKWLDADFNSFEPAKIGAAIRAAGIVGQGGAAFPTHVKFAKNEKKPIEALLVNGCECEPYLTTDYRLMIEAPEAIIAGALLAAKAVGADVVAIGIEDNKPKAVETMKAAASGTSVMVCVVHTKYPQGSEKQMIKALVGKEVPVGGLPMDVGVAVTNVGTAAAVARAVLRGKPLTHRVVCVTGAGIQQPKNLLVPIGIALRELIEYCGGLKPEAARLVAGGPMMGFSFSDLDMPVTKGTSGVTVLTAADVQKAEETACIRCGRCVDACPMKLVPTKLALASRKKDVDLAERYHLMACFECGCCAYVCPANLPIVQLVRTGKALLMARR